ncbi:tumor protein p53-inducible nuclear protein 1 isoform X2 [Anabrus simplex]
MFSNLANYLLGSHTQESPLPANAVAAEVRLSAVEADDDWVLVEKTGNRQDEANNSVESLSTLAVAISTIPHSVSSTNDIEDHHPLTGSSSTSSLPCLSFEESWFLTPPPCFTSEGPIHMETSPLENLLIEHPSMSVYQHSSHFSIPPQPRRAGSLPPSSSVSTSSGEEEIPVREHRIPEPSDECVVPLNARRQTVYSLQQQQERQCLQLRSAQKIQQRRVYQTLKRNHLDRHNKAREINSRNKVKRRSDYMQHHSGANNNRKC